MSSIERLLRKMKNPRQLPSPGIMTIYRFDNTYLVATYGNKALAARHTITMAAVMPSRIASEQAHMITYNKMLPIVKPNLSIRGSVTVSYNHPLAEMLLQACLVIKLAQKSENASKNPLLVFRSPITSALLPLFVITFSESFFILIPPFGISVISYASRLRRMPTNYISFYVIRQPKQKNTPIPQGAFFAKRWIRYYLIHLLLAQNSPPPIRQYIQPAALRRYLLESCDQ